MNLPSHIQRLQGVILRLTPVTFDITVRDTQKCCKYLQFANRGAHQGPSLKNLALDVLGRPIKRGRVSSVEDAIATMEIYRNAEADIEQEQGK
jgi:RNA exonuclease 4